MFIDTLQAISLIRKGDEAGLSMIYDAYVDAMYGIVFRIVKKHEETEEVVQSVFMKLWQNVSMYDDNKSTLFTWLAAVARNAALDMVKKKSFRVEKTTDSFSLSDYGLSVSSKPKMIDIDALTAKMPEKYKMLLEKMFLEGYTQQEIADLYEMPLGTVKTRLREAMNMLREELKEEKHLLYSIIFML